MKTSRVTVRRAARILLTLLVVPLLWLPLDHRELAHVLRSASPVWVAAAALAFAAELLVSSWKTAWLTAGRTTVRLQLRINCVKVFANQFLPGGLGGEALRVLWMTPHTGSVGRSAAAVWLDRLSGFYVQWTATLVSLAVLLGVSARGTLRMLAAGAALAAVGTFALPWILRRLLPSLAGWMRRLGGRDLPGSGRDAQEFQAAGKEIWGDGRRRLGLLVRAAMMQVTLVALTLAAGRAAGVAVSVWQASPIMLLGTLSTLAPLTVGNLGVTEGAFAAGFVFFGFRPEAGVAASLWMRLVLSPAAAFGGWIFLRAGMGRAAALRGSAPHAAA